jgi:hypothetical protein
VASDKFIILFLSCVSQYNQIIARKVVKGIETINPASREDLLAISPTKTTISDVMQILMKKYIIEI